MYAVVAKTSGSVVLTHNWVSTEEQAKHIVDRITGVPLGDAERDELTVRVASHKDPEDPLLLTRNSCIHCENRLKGLPVEKQSPGAYYAQLSPSAPGYKMFQGNPNYWVADTVNKTVSFDDAACLADEKMRHDYLVMRECEERIMIMYSPDEPMKGSQLMSADALEANVLQDKGRANWTVEELASWDALIARRAKAEACRASARALKGLTAGKNPTEIRDINPRQDIHWTPK